VIEPAVPPILTAAWDAYGDHREVVEVREISANVSTNSVYLLVLDDGHAMVAKRSSYGSYVHFRQDHYRIHEWIHRLRGTRYASFLAPVLLKNDEVFTYRDEDEWVVFYGQQPFYDFLPKVLTDAQVESLGQEMGLFHRACLEISDRVKPTWQSLGADVASLHDAIGSSEWRRERGFRDSSIGFVRAHCDAFLGNADALGYHEWTKIPVLIDWNIGNFSVGMDGDGFKFFSRWDYDWFRIEPRMLDLYFCARVVRAEGDQTAFSYTADPRGAPAHEGRAPIPQGSIPVFHPELRPAHRRALLPDRHLPPPTARGGRGILAPSRASRLRAVARGLVSREIPTWLLSR